MEFKVEGGWRDPVQLIARYPGYHIGSGKDGVWGLQDGKMHCCWLVCCDGLLGAVGTALQLKATYLQAGAVLMVGFCLLPTGRILFRCII